VHKFQDPGTVRILGLWEIPRTMPNPETPEAYTDDLVLSRRTDGVGLNCEVPLRILAYVNNG
jgi:hypothetical protein